MYRIAGPKTIKLDVVGDLLEMNCSDLSDLRGSVQLLVGSSTSVVVAFEFSCEPDGTGQFFEPDTATRLSAIGNGKVSPAAVDCKGFARVRMRVIAASPTADSLASFMLSSYSEVPQFGFAGRSV